MPTSIHQLRNWLKGRDVEGFPPHPKPDEPPKVRWKRCRECRGEGEDGRTICEVCDGIGAIPVLPGEENKPGWAEKMKGKARNRDKRTGGKYRINPNGTDAMIFFGKHRDKSLADIAKEDVRYLEWMVEKGEFDEDLVDVAKYNIIRHYKRHKTKKWLEHKAVEHGYPADKVRAASRDALEDYLMRNWHEPTE